MEKLKESNTQSSKPITYGSVCSGIEAATVAWHSLGWIPLWFAEIEKFPNQVLQHHYPNVRNIGDMTLIKQMIKDNEIDAPDILVGGTPCQAFSVAGLRNSLDDDRGQLSLEFVRLADEIDSKRIENGMQASIILWENVPGVLNTKDNAFGCFLGAIAGEGCELKPSGKRWPNSGCVFGPSRQVAWRVLNAQYFGLAQRRKRVFVIASARKESICEILFERKSMFGDSKESRGKGQNTSRNCKDSINRAIETLSGKQIFPTILANADKGWLGNQEAFSGNYFIKESIGICPRSLSLSNTLEKIGTLTAGDCKQPLAVVTTEINCIGGLHPHAAVNKELSSTLTNAMSSGGGHVPLVTYGIQGNIIGRSINAGGNGVGFREEQAPTLTVGDKHGVAYAMIADTTPKIMQEVNGTLRASGGGGIVPPSVTFQSIARYLTEIECERLQGFPDNYTNIPGALKGKRYKALGNSMAVPVMRWIGQRIILVLESNLTQQSLSQMTL
ncbi:DNA (cytosine-5)-methyltransferase 1 [Acinetobacter bereziniae]|uniref:DNA cytosine methyltransferase n=1 Tax=Acinetobacter bereziniae TaxID=106648 RepID=UPI00285676F5|nr:DNA cytosine methyltransferase [Acinetobacter bereziniae]MDR6541603.1 DNA (cytosine-5)-methyltransferase 1 [Acinetobacter bereziniae]